VYERDYIMRLITQVGQMLRAMLHAIREHRADDSLEIARDAVEALVDTDIALADAMTGEGLVTFLTAGGSLDVVRARLLGEVLLVRAGAFDEAGLHERADHERTRAREVLESTAHHADGEDAAHVERMLADLTAQE